VSERLAEHWAVTDGRLATPELTCSR
jgi:hypothetical protein